MHPKEEESGSVKSASCVATTAGPTPAAGEDSARRIRARVSYFENFVTEVEGLRLAQRSTCINQTSGCARGPSRGNRVCKRNATSQRRNGAVRRHVGGKTNESRTGSRHGVDSPWRAANVARRRPKKCTLQMEVVPDCKAAWSSRTASTSELGAASVCGPLRRDPQAGTSRRLDRHDSGSMITRGNLGKKERTIIHHSHHGGVKPLGARMLGPRKKRDGQRTRKPK